MRILIEEHRYDVGAIKQILHGIDVLDNVEGKVSIPYVGYYYNTLLRDCVFVLPKVLLKDVFGQEKVFGKYSPEEILYLSDKDNPLSHEERNFLYKFAVWIYRAIVVYKNSRQCDSNIIHYVKFGQVDKGRKRLTNTYLDILLSLIQFNKDNQDFIFFILKNIHSGYNKIHWNRTIGMTSAIIQNGSPIYLKPINRKRKINLDEELLIIFFSILNHISDVYGFPKNIACQFDLLKGNRFQAYLNGMGKTRLLQIKYKYFSDKALELWELCYSFFDESRNIYVGTAQREYMFVKSFYIVFESIIDELIGDNPLPDGLDKKQDDGKIVDHLFKAESLIKSSDKERQETYYIGDSKYYKIGHELDGESIYKQYTYARNVIQWNLDLLLDENKPNPSIRLRDELTESYNIIPNFFISAKMSGENFDCEYRDDGINKTNRTRNRHIKKQFLNRLFDRDTMLLFHYDVNFLYVLSLYARNNSHQKTVWKNKVRKRLCGEMRNWLQHDFDFYAMLAQPRVDGKAYIKSHFNDIIGKVYTSFPDQEIYTLALDNKDPEGNNEQLLTELRKYFFVIKCNLGTDPREAISKSIDKKGVNELSY